MPTTSTDHSIRARIDSFLSELSGLVRKAALESVEEVLSVGAAPTRRRGPGGPKRSRRRGPVRRRRVGRPRKAARRAVVRAGKRLRRSAADLEKIATRVLAHVKSNAGHRLEQIGKALKTDTAILKRPIQNLLAAKKLRTTGQKRGTAYFAGGGGGGARKTKVRRPAKRARKAKVRRRRPAKRAKRESKKKAVKARRSDARASDASASLEHAERMAAG